jgi:hypothetical protein
MKGNSYSRQLRPASAKETRNLKQHPVNGLTEGEREREREREKETADWGVVATHDSLADASQA